MFDLYETLIPPLIVRPVLTDLGHLKAGTPSFNLWVGLLFFVPTAIGGIFGLLGGYLTDLLGRRRVLVWSILLYAFSACAASYATSVPQFQVLRCATMAGVFVEYVAALAWLAELFSNPKQRESVLALTQTFHSLGGLLVAGAYYFAVTLAEVRDLAPRQVEQTVSSVQLLQELGGVTGRIVFGLLVIRIVAQRRRMRIFLVPALIAFSWLYFFAATHGLALLYCGAFLATLLFNGLHSFWGNYLPKVYPTHLRGTGEGFAINVGGRTIGVSAAFLTTQLANMMPGSDAAARLAYSVGAVALLVCLGGLAGSFWLREPVADQLPD